MTVPLYSLKGKRTDAQSQYAVSMYCKASEKSVRLTWKRRQDNGRMG